MADSTDYMEAYYKRLAERKSEAKESLKGICQTLLDVGVTKVTVHYDGYGDSGTIETVTLFKGDEEIKESEVEALGLPMLTYEKLTYGNINGGEDRLVPVECTVVDKIEDCAYDFLPGGWEINEGSFGDLQIDTKLCTVVCEHNHRIETSEYQEESFEL